ncbi:MAG TPA: DNA-binding protein [Xanthobacteraceae bacterium]|nr:DNA-binding protein [Xanthobacteraceae bacterium]
MESSAAIDLAAQPADSANARISDDDLLTTPVAAKDINLSESYLEKLRICGGGPEFLKFGRAVRYRRGTLRAWRDSHAMRTTREAAV